MATLLQSRTKVRVDISQEDTTLTDFTDNQLNGFLNEGARYISALVKKPTDHVEIQVEQGKEGYTLPSDALLLLDAYFGDENVSGDRIPLEIVTEETMKTLNPFWLDNTTSNQGRPQRIFLLDAQTVAINPKPDATNSASGKKLILNYCYQPAALSTDADTWVVPIVFHDLIAEYAEYRCYMGKLNKPDVGMAIFNGLSVKAKKLEGLVNKEQLNSGFSWGSSVGEDIGIYVGVGGLKL